MKKQIEEMAKDIHKSPWRLQQDYRGSHINGEELAEYFYNKGYRKQSEWISVDERLPEECVPVLVYKSKHSEAYGNMETAYYCRGIWRGVIGENVTHWMPLPEPPKMEGE